MRSIRDVEQMSWQSYHSEPPPPTNLVIAVLTGKTVASVWMDGALDRFPLHPLDHLGTCWPSATPFLGNWWPGALEPEVKESKGMCQNHGNGEKV